MGERGRNSKFGYAYLVTSDGSFFSHNANAYQKCKLVVNCLKGRILLPRGKEGWVHPEFVDSVSTFYFPNVLLRRPFVALLYPIMYFVGVWSFRKRVSNWLFAPSNEGTFLGVWLVEKLFRIKAFLFCWDPPGINLRDRVDFIGRTRCVLIDCLMGKAIKNCALMILNLHPDFLKGRFSKYVLRKIKTFPNGTNIKDNQTVIRDVVKMERRIGINSKFESVKGCWGVAKLIVRIWRKHGETSIVWVGDGKEYSKVYDYLLAQGIPQGNLIMPGQVTHHKAMELLASAQVALNGYDAKPSLKWNYVLKLPEFMSIGLPVVSVDTPGAREYLESGVSGVLFKPGDWGAVFSAIEALMVNKDKCASMSQKAQYKVRNYDWELINHRIANVVKDTVE